MIIRARRRSETTDPSQRPIHAMRRRCSSVTYPLACALLAPRHPGASDVERWIIHFCATPERSRSPSREIPHGGLEGLRFESMNSDRLPNDPASVLAAVVRRRARAPSWACGPWPRPGFARGPAPPPPSRRSCARAAASSAPVFSARARAESTMPATMRTRSSLTRRSRNQRGVPGLQTPGSRPQAPDPRLQTPGSRPQAPDPRLQVRPSAA
jgi:hypothetical protein